MKKYFMFVAVAAAGMLASCSSESLTAGSDPKIEPTQDDRVPIEIGVASAQTKASTRGTGTAGDLATGTNIWNGERINVLMYEIDPSGNPTFNPTQDANGFNLYDENISLVTPLTDENTATGIAKEPTNPATIGAGQTYKVKYYPATGRSDFWGYYLGGFGYTVPPTAPAANDAAGDGTLTMYEDAALATPTITEADANYVATDFVINGTHDLLVGKATSTNPDAYSAKAARAGIQPNITFNHLLTRLTFKAEAGNEDAANASVTVTGIKVHSKTTGKLIVAYKVAPANRIVWDSPVMTDDPTPVVAADYKAYPALTLKERTSAVDRTLTGLNAVPLTWSAGAAVPENIGEALLVAPQDQYYIEVDYQVSAKAARDWYHTTSGYVAVPAGPAGTLTVGKIYYTDINGGGAFVADGTEISTGSNYFQVLYTAVPNGTTLTAGKTYYTTPDDSNPHIATGTEVSDGTNYYEIFVPGDLINPATPIVMPTYKTTIPTTASALNTTTFEAGNSYEIGITLYGPEEIKITTTLTAWEDGGTDTIVAE